MVKPALLACKQCPAPVWSSAVVSRVAGTVDEDRHEEDRDEGEGKEKNSDTGMRTAIPKHSRL